MKEKKCTCKEESCKEDCKNDHTHKEYFCLVCVPIEEDTPDWKEKFENHIDKRYGDGMGHFTFGAKTRHIADVFEDFISQILLQQRNSDKEKYEK